MGQTRVRRIGVRAVIVSAMVVLVACLLWTVRSPPRTLVADLMVEGRTGTRARPVDVSIAGVSRRSFVVEGQRGVRLPSVPVVPGALLSLRLAIDERVWQEPGDGVLFEIFVERGRRRRLLLFSRYLDAKTEPTHRGWVTAEIDLATKLRADGELPSSVDLLLKTSAGYRGDTRHDAAVWADVRVERPWFDWSFSSPQRPPNVLLLSMDTLRADHVGAFGYDGGTTPHVDRLAEEGFRFTRAYAPANHTLESHMSVLTGLYPSVHGVRAKRGDRGARSIKALPKERITLAEALQAQGYVTGGFAYDCVWLRQLHGFGQGFAVYEDRRYAAPVMNEKSIFPWLDTYHGAPFFLFVHYYDVHSDWQKLPYDAPARFRAKHSGDYAGSFTGCGDDDVCATRYLMQLDSRRKSLADEELGYIRSLYDAGVAATDAAVGELLAKLERLGVLQDTIVVVMSDHGEEFREHGRFIHSQIYEEIVRVPLIFRLPGAAKQVGRSDAPVRLIDVMPTLLDLLGIAPSAAVQGRSLVPLMQGQQLPPEPVVVVGNGRVGVIDWPWKLLRGRPRPDELYHLERDPNEEVDVSGDSAAKVAELGELLTTLQAEFSRFDAANERTMVEPSDADIDRLKALGYLP